MIWNKEYESMPISERKSLQFDRLKHILSYAYDSIPYYQQSFDKAGIKPTDFKQLSDIWEVILEALASGHINGYSRVDTTPGQIGDMTWEEGDDGDIAYVIRADVPIQKQEELT